MTPTRTQLRRINLIKLFPAVAVGGILTVATDAHTWWHAVVLGVGVLAALVAFERWTAHDLARVVLPCLIITAAVWAAGVLLIGSSSSFFGLLVVGPLAVPQLSRHRAAATVALSAYVGVIGASRFLVDRDDFSNTLLVFVLIPAGVTAIVTGLMFPNKRFYDVVTDLEESRERDAELAVARERVRFAGDLHDIQGHTLHVVKLKTALAQKLVHTDPGRAAEELREIYALVSDTITQTKELAYAQRRLNLSAELENAKNLFEAAGIGVRITREAEPDARTSQLLGQVLRETTTNILRHAQATHVRITLARSGISIGNDGAAGDSPLELRGLSALRQRVADDGGELTAEQKDGTFLTAATFPGKDRR